MGTIKKLNVNLDKMDNILLYAFKYDKDKRDIIV